MRHVSTILLSVLLLGLLGLLGNSAAPAPAARTPTARRASRVATASCPFPLGPGMVAGKTVRCGYLVVPADRGRPHGRMLRLAVAIFKSPSPTSASDPVVFLQGGPGLPLLSIAAHVALPALFSAFAQYGNRDIIMLDQRGTGYSQQSLGCPELAAAHYRPIVQDRPLDQNLTSAFLDHPSTKPDTSCIAAVHGFDVPGIAGGSWGVGQGTAASWFRRL